MSQFYLYVSEIGDDGEETSNREIFNHLTEVASYLFGTQFHRDPSLHIDVYNESGSDQTVKAIILALYLEKGARLLSDAQTDNNAAIALDQELVEEGIYL